MSKKTSAVRTGGGIQRLLHTAPHGLDAISLTSAICRQHCFLTALDDYPRDVPQATTASAPEYTSYCGMHDLDLIARLVPRIEQVSQKLGISQDADEGDCFGIDTEKPFFICSVEVYTELIGSGVDARGSLGIVCQRGAEKTHRELELPGVQCNSVKPQLPTYPSLCPTVFRVPGQVRVTPVEAPAAMSEADCSATSTRGGERSAGTAETLSPRRLQLGAAPASPCTPSVVAAPDEHPVGSCIAQEMAGSEASQRLHDRWHALDIRIRGGQSPEIERAASARET